jgi:O-antigen ligase
MRIATDRWTPVLPYGAATALGGIVGLFVSRAVELEFRYFAALVVGVILLSAGMLMLGRIRHVLLYLLAFNLAFTTIEKTFLINPSPTFINSGITVGIADIALAALYLLWIGAIVMKREPVPTPNWLDAAVLAFIGMHVVSLTSSLNPQLTILEIVRVSKFALLYLYLSRNVTRVQLKYLVVGILFAMTVQAALGVFQHRTGRLMGIGRTKGAAIEYEQYSVSGFEQVRRAEGTTFDSHALGLFFAMTLPIPMMLGMNRALSRSARIISAVGFGVGIVGVIISFSRAGWLAFAVGTGVLLLCFIRWKQWRIIAGATAAGTALAVAFALPFARYIKQRLFEAPPELVHARFETYQMGFALWKFSPYTGIGANAYMVGVQDKLGVVEGDPYFVPAHNMLMLLLVEMGPLGMLAFVLLTIVAAAFCWRVVARAKDPILQSLAAALLAALVALHVEGVTDPIYVTGVTYYLFWFELGLIGAVYRLADVPRLRMRSSIRA